MENDTLEYANTFGMTVPAVSVDRKKRQETIPLVFHKGWRAVPHEGTKSYPYASSYADSVNDLTLAWEGTNGLIEKYHKDYMACDIIIVIFFYQTICTLPSQSQII